MRIKRTNQKTNDRSKVKYPADKNYANCAIEKHRKTMDHFENCKFIDVYERYIKISCWS